MTKQSENNLVKLKELKESTRFLLPNAKRTQMDTYVVLRNKERSVEFYNEFTGQMFFDNGEMTVMKVTFNTQLDEIQKKI